jgi:hypothetical protein
MPSMNELSLTHDGSIYWNGAHITSPKLKTILDASHRLNPEPVVFLQTEAGVSCDVLDKLRDQMDRALDCHNSNRCAEGIPAVWRGLPTPPGTPIS